MDFSDAELKKMKKWALVFRKGKPLSEMDVIRNRWGARCANYAEACAIGGSVLANYADKCYTEESDARVRQKDSSYNRWTIFDPADRLCLSSSSASASGSASGSATASSGSSGSSGLANPAASVAASVAAGAPPLLALPPPPPSSPKRQRRGD